MTVDTIDTNSPTVFDAGLPPIAYEHAHNPENAHRLIRQARMQGPIALGPHGPEVLIGSKWTNSEDPASVVPGRTGSHRKSQALDAGQDRPRSSST
jgi:hypothetical protein